MAAVDSMTETERMRYWAQLAEKSWFTPNEDAEIVELEESEDKLSLTVTLRKKG